MAETAETAVRWLDETELKAWRALIFTTTGLLATLDNELQAAHGLSLGDYEVLVFLSEAPERAMRMSDLANRLRLSPSGITRRIDGLVRSGLVERKQCPSDRRGSFGVLRFCGTVTVPGGGDGTGSGGGGQNAGGGDQGNQGGTVTVPAGGDGTGSGGDGQTGQQNAGGGDATTALRASWRGRARWSAARRRRGGRATTR